MSIEYTEESRQVLESEHLKMIVDVEKIIEKIIYTFMFIHLLQCILVLINYCIPYLTFIIQCELCIDSDFHCLKA